MESAGRKVENLKGYETHVEYLLKSPVTAQMLPFWQNKLDACSVKSPQLSYSARSLYKACIHNNTKTFYFLPINADNNHTCSTARA